MVIIPELNRHIHNVVWRKGVVSLMSTQSVVETTPVFIVRAPLVVSSAVRLGDFMKECPMNEYRSGNGEQ